MVIIQNGEVKAILMSVKEYDQMKESLSLLRMLADSTADVEAGRLREADAVFDELREMIKKKSSGQE